MIVVHLFTNLDDLIDAGKTVGSLPSVLIGYYGPFTLSLFTRLCPLFALMAMLFAVTWLKRTNELTALMAAGIPKGRVLRFPLIAMVGLVSLSTGIREFVIPHYQDVLSKTPQDLSGENYRALRPALDPLTGILIAGHHIELLNQQIIRPIFRLSGPAAILGPQISAETAKYEPANDTHPAGYLISGVTTTINVDKAASFMVNGVPVVHTPSSSSWLEPDQLFLTSSVQFFLLQGGSSWGQYDSVWSIVRRLHAQPSFYGPDVHVKIHSRLTQSIADVSLIFFGLPVVLRRTDRHLFWLAAGTTSSIVFFTVFSLGIQTFAANSQTVPPFIGAWLPLLVLAPIAWARAKVAMLS